MERLTVFQTQLEEDFQGIGFAREARRFRPHLTLGRVKNPGDVSGVNEALRSFVDYRPVNLSARKWYCSRVNLPRRKRFIQSWQLLIFPVKNYEREKTKNISNKKINGGMTLCAQTQIEQKRWI